MAVVNVYFAGICTHFSRTHHPQLPLSHRVVLVNASAGAMIGGKPIPPHTATVQIGQGQAIPIHGCTMTLRAPNAAAGTIIEGVGYQYLPNLSELVKGRPGEALSPPAPDVVFEPNFTKAALCVDFDSGTLEVFRGRLDAIFARLTMESEQILLVSEPFSGALLPQELSNPITLTADTMITIANFDSDSNAGADDFLLHYLTATTIPPDPPLPSLEQIEAVPPASPQPGWDLLVGAGCSNSIYP